MQKLLKDTEYWLSIYMEVALFNTCMLGDLISIKWEMRKVQP